MRIQRKDYTRTVRQASLACGFCATGDHDVCKTAYRNGDGSVLICGCGCKDATPTECHWCHTTEPDFIGEGWLCKDADDCEARLKTKLDNDPVIQMIRKHRTEPKVVVSKYSRGGSCLCCDQPTKGGKFLPGHDSTWLKALQTLPKDEALAKARSVSDALANKLEKRMA